MTLSHETRRLTVGFRDLDSLREVCGERDDHLRWLEDRLGVAVQVRGTEIRLEGRSHEATLAGRLLGTLSEQVARGIHVDSELLEGLLARESTPVAPVARPRNGGTNPTAERFGPAGRKVEARSPGQRAYLESIRAHDVVFAVGPAGSGKTWLAVASAITALERREVRRIVLTRPAVEAGEHLGFLPGDLAAKVNPYLRPLFDALAELVDEERLERMLEKGQIEIAPLAFMRGRTLAGAFVIFDEAQNCSVAQMAMLLTRLGQDAKVVVTGDLTQSDLPRGKRSGLNHAVEILSDLEGIGIVRLTRDDVVRHPLVARIVEAYANHAAHRAAEQAGA